MDQYKHLLPPSLAEKKESKTLSILVEAFKHPPETSTEVDLLTASQN